MNNSSLSVIITGSTGMVGEGVLHLCLEDPAVEKILVINRKPGGLIHPKLKEIIHADFFNLGPIADQLCGYNTCFFCLGISSVGVKEPAYYHITYTLTMHFAQTLSRGNRGMTFCYISGAGTDSSEKGRSMWARVKGKTENDLHKFPFESVFAFRPGFIRPIKGLKHTHSFYRYIDWLFPIGRVLYPGGFCTMRELGLAMIYTARYGYQRPVIEGNDIIELAKSQNNPG